MEHIILLPGDAWKKNLSKLFHILTIYYFKIF